MGMWKWVPGKKAKHDHEAGSSSGSTATHSTSPVSFSISPPTAAPCSRPYVKAKVCGRAWIRGLTLTLSPSPSPPPQQPPAMAAEEEERLLQAVMEDSEREFKRGQEEEWEGLEEITSLLGR